MTQPLGALYDFVTFPVKPAELHRHSSQIVNAYVILASLCVSVPARLVGKSFSNRYLQRQHQELQIAAETFL